MEAHALGIRTTSTIMHGTVETWEDRIDHMFLLRDVQRQTHGFTEFIPLTFMHENNRLSDVSQGASGMDDLKVHAVARVIFGRDIPNIQVSWPKMGVKLSQVALSCGANDFGGTMMEDKITTARRARSTAITCPARRSRRLSGPSAASPRAKHALRARAR